ncbi:MAG: DUF4259 domain-containing protein [Pseudomonadales bacterium]|nr:DUF4259 domain-containing protein [Pseudomonadales bacterium]
MGAWGLDVFENDSAMDWLFELTESDGASILEEALSIDAEEYIEVDEGSAALAAIEVINSLRDKGPVNLPGPVSEWINANRSIETTNLVTKAKRVLGIVSNPEISEVSQLWLEQEYDWDGMVNDIAARLNA